MESFKSGSRFLIIFLNFDWKSAKITIFRLIYSSFSSLLAWSLWLSISISSILWRPFCMVICIRKAFYKILTIENRGRMSQISHKSGNNGFKTKALPIFFCVITRIHSWIKNSNFLGVFVNYSMKKIRYEYSMKYFTSSVPQSHSSSSSRMPLPHREVSV